MPFRLFHDLFPELAEAETRSLIVPEGGSGTGLPPGDYAFCEMFCNEPGCDCRRVFYLVASPSRPGPEAVITWGWESPEFYASWLRRDDPEMIAELMGPGLNLGSPATDLADDLLGFAREVLLRDEAYTERVKRHYRLFRARLEGNSVGSSREEKA